MSLSHFDLKNTKPADKPYKISDGGGLFILVQPNGSMLWRMKYQFVGIERLLSFGAYPSVSLADARTKRDEARKLIAAGTDPSVQKKLDRLAAETAARSTFGVVAAEYLANLEAVGSAPTTLKRNRWFLEEIAKPIANRPIAEITPAELLDLLKHIEKSGRRETACMVGLCAAVVNALASAVQSSVAGHARRWLCAPQPGRRRSDALP